MSFRCFAMLVCLSMSGVAGGEDVNDTLQRMSSSAAQEANAKFQKQKLELVHRRLAAERKIEETFDVELAKLRDALIKSLGTVLDTETQDGKLDSAVEIRDAIERIRDIEVAQLAPEATGVDQQIAALREQVETLERDLRVARKQLDDRAVAQIEVISGSSGLGEFRNRARAFSNRKYHWVGVPEDSPFRHVTTVSGGGDTPLVLKIVRAGRVTIAISHDTAAVMAYMKREGWRPTNQRFGYSDNKPSLLHVYTKDLEPGIVSLPSLAWAGPIALLP